jgi:hypothetical protein
VIKADPNTAARMPVIVPRLRVLFRVVSVEELVVVEEQQEEDVRLDEEGVEPVEENVELVLVELKVEAKPF